MIHYDALHSYSTFILLLSVIMTLTWIGFAYNSPRDTQQNTKDYIPVMLKRDRYIVFMLALVQISFIALSIQVNMAVQIVFQPGQQETREAAEAQAVENTPQPVTNPPKPEEVPIPHTITSATPVVQASKLPFSDIIEFNESNSKQQAYIDMLKQRYETWLVTYYYLQKCNKVEASDLDLIKDAMKKDLENAKADASVMNNILIAATGSFKEMYNDIPCDVANITSTKANYDSTMIQIKSLKSEQKKVKQ